MPSLFTPEELEEMRRADAEIEAAPLSAEEIRASAERDRLARLAGKDTASRKAAERQREHRQANKERLTEYQREYYQANKERLTEYQREYYQANKERKREYQREYRQANKERRRIEEARERDNTTRARQKLSLGL